MLRSVKPHNQALFANEGAGVARFPDAKDKPNAKQNHGGTTNILLNDENGKPVANLLVTNAQYWSARSAKAGTVVYRKDPECSPDCVMTPKAADAPQTNPNQK
jgi:hypothetical protein